MTYLDGGLTVMATVRRVGLLGLVLILLLAGCDMPPLGTADGADGVDANAEPSDAASDEGEPADDAPDEPELAASASDVGGPGPRSGLPWTSGSNGQHEIHQDEVNDFADWRGAPADVAMVYTRRHQPERRRGVSRGHRGQAWLIVSVQAR